MAQANEHVVQRSLMWPAKVLPCYKNGWRQLWKYVLELLLIGVIGFVIALPGYRFYGLGEESGGIVAVFGMLGLAWFLLLSGPIDYGVSFAHLKAARANQLKIKDMFDVFQNYLNAVLANLLVGVIVGIGIVLLIVPGIIFACKFAFTPYLVVERRMEVIEAVKESWRMTKGHAWQVFLIGLLAIPIAMAGLLCFGVGIVVAIMWIRLAFASLYHAVSVSGEESHPESAP